VARAILLRAKLARRPELLDALAAHLAASVLESGDGVDPRAIVPVPSHPLADLRRGFSPAGRLARGLGARLGIPVRRLLRRRFWSLGSAKHLGRAKRQRLLRSAIVCRKSPGPGPVLLVDDVMTTGSSLDACARALRRAGVTSVQVAVWGRTPPENSRHSRETGA
jgi:predicted amidophosphoribosyltransferase